MKKKNNNGNTLILILLLLSVCVMVFAAYKLWGIHRMYAEGDAHYETITQTVKNPIPETSPPLDTPREPQVDIPELGIDFEALGGINEDAVAWLYGPDTVIDYPVLRADNYDDYLRHLPDGTYNANGSLFLDYNNPADFSGRLNIIYGHNMDSGKMFGSLTGYKQQAYFEEHPYLYLYTKQGNYRIDVLYGCVVGAGDWRDRAFMYESNLDSLLEYAAYHTTVTSDGSYTQEDRFLVLSTCSYEFDDARYVVIGVMQPEYRP